MTVLTPIWSIDEPCDKSVGWLEERLSLAGFRLLRTFDLHDARLSVADCQCPHHGTKQCDCQMMVLLVYAEASPPVTLVIHGKDGRSWISVIDRPGQRADPCTTSAIQRALQIPADPGVSA
jgi:hypothetical protein